jgi:hypothetical protein
MHPVEDMDFLLIPLFGVLYRSLSGSITLKCLLQPLSTSSLTLNTKRFCRVKYMLSILTLNCQPEARKLRGASIVCVGLEL